MGGADTEQLEIGAGAYWPRTRSGTPSIDTLKRRSSNAAIPERNRL